MLDGKMYDGFDPDMVNARARAHKLSLQYNQTYEFDKAETANNHNHTQQI